MDFDDTPQESQWRTRCFEFLHAHAEKRPRVVDWSNSPWAHASGEDKHQDHVETCKQWQRLKFDAGWAGLTWPAEFGGQGQSSHFNGIFREEEARFDVATGLFAQSIGMAGPTIIAHGTEDQKQRFLTPMLTGEHVWCQLFSEPEAGSDLAGLRTTGVVDGDEMVVNGQKVWTSNATDAVYGMLLVRTNADVPKHRGITYLLVDMTTPGIDIRPLKQMTGRAEFSEVFLDDVRLPMANVVGEVDKGWGPILTTLSNEREGIASNVRAGVSDVAALARRFGVLNDPTIRQDLARLHSIGETIRFLGYRVRTAASRGEAPGPESSILKLAASRRLALQGDLVMTIMGAKGMLYDTDAEMNGFWQNYAFLMQWASRIGGGTEQVQRNIVGDNVLGMPREPRLDKGIPFRDIPT